MSPEELAELLASSSAYEDYFEIAHTPLLAVLDTSCVRTGLHYQLENGSPPASVTTAQDGSIRLFMEYDTLAETSRKLPKFAKQLGVPMAELVQTVNTWLPYISVVRLPPALRQVDARALDVRATDADDYPAAALAALLSPCILLTHNYTDFGALGVKTPGQGVDAVIAGVGLRRGESHYQVTVMVPAAPVMAIGGAAKWASKKIGPAAWLLLGTLAVGGVWLYFRQPQERREGIKEAAVKVGAALFDELEKASAEMMAARVQLRAGVVPGPAERTPTSAVLRELAMSEESLSAQQLADLLDPPQRPPVAELRAFLRANDEALFVQVRRGGFVLGRHYMLRDP
jgi:hypothetical protein